MNKPAYTYLPNLLDEVGDAPAESIVSKTFFKSEAANAVLFALAAGEELSEHTSARPAILHFLEGEGRLTLGRETFSVAPGAWVHMPANMQHSITAGTPLKMLLLLL